MLFQAELLPTNEEFLISTLIGFDEDIVKPEATYVFYSLN